MPWYARPLITILSLILAGFLAWQGVQYALHSRHRNVDSIATNQSSSSPSGQIGWQRDVGVSLDEAIRHATEGDVTQTEVAIDRASSILTVARLHADSAPLDFFETVLAKFDQILSAYHESTRLIEHVTLARIELAQLRSSTERVPAGTPTTFNPADLLLPRGSATENKPETAAPGKSADSAVSETPANQIVVRAPRVVGTGSKLDAASLGGNVLDATGMPSTSEIVEPPASRLFVDDVRVEGLTIAGAAQTIDGIHWKNVTFVGTRLRYEGGELDLQNVRFIHCMFGFTTDRRAARIANAIALGQTTIVIE
jgi:hypothetical protein